MKYEFSVGCVAALVLAAGAAYGQCSNPTVTNGTIVGEPGVTDVGLTGDDANMQVFLPFSVEFYGLSYNTINVCTNGWASFESVNTAYANTCLPNNGGAPNYNRVPGPSIFPHWDDLYVDPGLGQGVFTTLSGDPGSQRFTINWRAERLASGTVHDFSVVLHENSSRIDFIYSSVPEQGLSATIGVQDGQASFYQVQCNTGGISDFTSITFECPPPTVPQGTGQATPNRLFQGGTTLLTVTAQGAQTPPASTGITVTADLSSIGGSATQALFDDGTNGDVTAGDLVFSYNAQVNAAGQVTLPFTVADAQARSSMGSISLTAMSLTDMGPLAGGLTSTTPADTAGSEIRWYKFTVGDISAAGLDYLDIYTSGGSDTELGLYRADGTLVVNDDDDDAGLLSAMSFGVTTPARPANGTGMPFNGRDGDLPAGEYYLALGTFNTTFNAANFDATSTGGAGFGMVVNFVLGEQTNPFLDPATASGNVGGNVLLAIQAHPGIEPPSTSLTVTGDLSTIGGSSSQAFYDDGTHGDAAAGDNVFSYTATIPHAPGQATGVYNLPMTVTDNLSRVGPGTIVLTLAAEPVGGCCVAGSCSVTTAYLCGQSGGTYNGDGTNCGTIAYDISTTPETFASIAGSGFMAGTVSDCDDCTEVVTLPFGFSHFGNVYNEVRISSNGNLQFGASNSAAYFNGPIPSAATPNNAVYPLWDDYNTFEQGEVYYQETGTAPARKFIIEWNNVTQYTAGGFWPPTSETFQVILHEGSNNVEFRYGVITPINTSGVDQGSGQDASGGDRTIGVENEDGTIAFSHPSANHNGESLMLAYSVPGNPCAPGCATSDYDGDGDAATDADIEAFFACLAGNCCATCWHLGADIDADGDSATDADIEAFFRILAGNAC